MQVNEYFARKLYRVPVLLFAALVVASLLLNLPCRWVEVRVVMQSESAASAQRPMALAALLTTAPGERQVWSPSRSLGQYAGWPDARMIDSSSHCFLTQWLAALSRNAWRLLQINAMAVAVCIGLQWVSLAFNNRWPAVTRKSLWTGCLASAVGLMVLATRCGCGDSESVDYQAALARGEVSYGVEAPAFIAKTVPCCLFYPLVRLNNARLSALDSDSLDRLLQEPALQKLHLSQCRIDRKQWRALVAHPELVELQLEDCALMEGGAAEPKMDWTLGALVIHNVQGLKRVAEDFQHCSSLRQLRIQQAADEITWLLSTMNLECLTQLELVVDTTRERLGQTISQESCVGIQVNRLNGLTGLTIRCVEGHGWNRESTPAIKVSNCAALQTFQIDGAAWWDVSLSRLDRLKEIRTWSPCRDALPTTWPKLRSLELVGLRSLRVIDVTSSQLEELIVDDCPAIEALKLCPYDCMSAPSECVSDVRPGNEDIDGPSKSDRLERLLHRQQWLGQLKSLNLDGNELAGVDLSFIGEMKRLEDLELDHTGVSASQLVEAGKLPQLTSLSMRRERVASDELNAILDQYPALQSLNLDAAVQDRLELVNRPELRRLVLHRNLYVSDVLIKDCPLLCSCLYFMAPLRSLCIQQVPKLTELYVLHAVPLDTQISGLGGLREVYLHGDQLNDRHVEELARCMELDILSISAANVSTDSLRKLRACSKLTVLLLPDTPVDDVTLSWLLPRETVCELDLTGTRITGASMSTIVQATNLQKLWLGRTAIKPDELMPVVSLSRMFQLDVSGVGVNAETLAMLLGHEHLERLSLAYSRLTPEVWELLVGGAANNLIVLNLEHCGISETSLAQLRQLSPRTTIVAATPVMTEDEAAIQRMELVAR